MITFSVVAAPYSLHCSAHSIVLLQYVHVLYTLSIGLTYPSDFYMLYSLYTRVANILLYSRLGLHQPGVFTGVFLIQIRRFDPDYT